MKPGCGNTFMHSGRYVLSVRLDHDRYDALSGDCLPAFPASCSKSLPMRA